MSMKTDNPAEVGMHVFERAGLGRAPFRFVGASQNRIQYPDGSSKPGGSCDYCGTGIELECHVVSADGKHSKVGCDCIRRADDSGLLTAYKSSLEYRQHQQKLRDARARANYEALRKLIDGNRSVLQAQPHPLGYVDRRTGAPLTRLDWAEWMAANCGASGRADVLKRLRGWLSSEGKEVA